MVVVFLTPSPEELAPDYAVTVGRVPGVPDPCVLLGLLVGRHRGVPLGLQIQDRLSGSRGGFLASSPPPWASCSSGGGPSTATMAAASAIAAAAGPTASSWARARMAAPMSALSASCWHRSSVTITVVRQLALARHCPMWFLHSGAWQWRHQPSCGLVHGARDPPRGGKGGHWSSPMLPSGSTTLLPAWLGGAVIGARPRFPSSCPAEGTCFPSPGWAGSGGMGGFSDPFAPGGVRPDRLGAPFAACLSPLCPSHPSSGARPGLGQLGSALGCRLGHLAPS